MLNQRLNKHLCDIKGTKMDSKFPEIILPIEKKPAIVSRNIHALRLSIIQKCDEQGINYVYNNYIQLFLKKNARDM